MEVALDSCLELANGLEQTTAKDLMLGPAENRLQLFFAVMRLVQVDDAFAREYLRLRQRAENPLTKMQALGALMNKLLRILWALVRKQTFYNPAFVHTA